MFFMCMVFAFEASAVEEENDVWFYAGVSREKGQTHFMKWGGDIQFQRGAQLGNIKCMIALADMYYFGSKHVIRDMAKARDLYLNAMDSDVSFQSSFKEYVEPRLNICNDILNNKIGSSQSYISHRQHYDAKPFFLLDIKKPDIF